MGIVSIKDIPGGRSASWSGQGGRQYTQQLRIITDGATVGPKAVMQSLNFRNGTPYWHPLVLSRTEEDKACFIQSLDVKEEGEDGKQWVATISYGPFSWGEQGGAGDEGILDPFKVPPKVRFDDAKFDTAAVYDTQTGKPILNTVGDPFIPPLKKEETRPILTIVRNEPVYDINWVQQFKDHVNADTFLGFAPNSVKCASITAEQEYHADFGYYYVVSYTFELRPVLFSDADSLGRGGGVQLTNGFTERVLNAGLREKKESVVRKVIVSGSPVSEAVSLTKAGLYDPTAAPYFLDVNIFPMAEFSKLSLDEDLLKKTVFPPPTA